MENIFHLAGPAAIPERNVSATRFIGTHEEMTTAFAGAHFGISRSCCPLTEVLPYTFTSLFVLTRRRKSFSKKDCTVNYLVLALFLLQNVKSQIRIKFRT